MPTTVRGDPQERLEQAMVEYLQEVDAGRRPDRSEFLARYPDLGTELEALLTDDGQLEMLTRPLLPEPLDLRGYRIDDYELLEPIGIGGMGIVWKAQHVKGNFPVALKMILAGPDASAAEIQRFVREIELHARLNHAHIVPIYHVGEHGGLRYFTMKLVEAGTLKSRLDRVRLLSGGSRAGKRRSWSRGMIRKSAERIARLMAKVAEAVHHAHQHRLLHRDLKPGNILLHGRDHPYVADFGLVLRIEEAGGTCPVEGTPPYMAPEQVAAAAPPPPRLHVEGTPPYMAPEQAAGTVSLSTAVDVYGLGAVLYELLTGRPPFTGDNTTVILEKVRAGKPVPPSQIEPATPRELEQICLKCLEKEPSKRYSSAKAVAKALNCFVEGKTVPGVPTPRWKRAAKWARRKPAAVALVATLIIALGLGLGLGVERYRAAIEAQQKGEHDLYVKSIPEAERTLSEGYRDRAEDILEQCPRRLRNLEWHLLKRACQPDGITLRNHSGTVVGIVSDLVGGQMATASRDGTVRLWDAKTGKQLHVLDERKKALCSLASGHQGKYLAAAGEDGVVRAWEVTRHDHKKVMEREAGTIVALARDVGKMAAAGRDGKVRVWDLPSGSQAHVLEYPGEVYCMAFSPDGKWLAVGGQVTGANPGPADVDKLRALQIWDMTTGKETDHFDVNPQPQHPVYALAWGWGGPEARRLVVATSSAARIWNATKGELAGFLPGYESWATGLAFDRSGQHVAAGFQKGPIRVWAFRQNGAELVFSVRRHRGMITSMSLDPSGDRVAYATDAGVMVERCKNYGGVRPVSGQRFAFSPDGKYLATAFDGSVELLDSDTLQPRGEALRVPGSSVTSLAFSPTDGTRLATGSRDGTVRVWDLGTRKEVAILKHQNQSPVRSVAYSLDGLLLASADENGTVKVWEATTGKALHERLPHPEAVPCLAFSPNKKYLAAACRDRQVTVWHLETGNKNILPAASLGVTSVTFSPDGRWLASAGEDQTVKLWEVGSEVRWSKTLRNPAGVSVAFAHDSRRLVSVGQDGRMRFWETDTGQELLTLTPTQPNTRSPGVQVGFNPNRRQVATAFENGNIEIRDWAPEERPAGNP